ncbi:hypothetical protein ACMFMG_008050 [Clarireedia jacksonii]
MHMFSSWPLLEDSTTFGLNPWHQVGGFDPFSALPEKSGEPIHRPILIEYFLRKLAPWLSHCDDGQLPNTPAYSWLPFALHHPPLFYALLLSAVVHLDRIQPMDKQILLWYKIETMRLANERLNIPDEGIADQMLIVVLILLYFNRQVGGGNAREYETHLAGIHQMIILRGGIDKLGMRGMVKNWLEVCYGPWKPDWHYGLFAEFHGIKQEAQREEMFTMNCPRESSQIIINAN